MRVAVFSDDIVQERPGGAPLGRLLQTPAAPENFRCWKHSLQKTGRPCVGRKGTVVSFPHAEQEVWVSTRSRTGDGPALTRFARFALQVLQRLGSFLNCLSAKNSCSPAVQTNSDAQSTHRKTLSWNSIARHLVSSSIAPRVTPSRDEASCGCAYGPMPVWPAACPPASDRKSAS